jgi:cytolysin (calcineurin-like family phosphatase)
MLMTFLIFIWTITGTLTSPIPISLNGQLLTIEHLNPQEHQIFFRQMGEYAKDVKFHHVHIPIYLDRINQVADKAIEKAKAYAKNVNKESKMHYHEDNQYADNKKSQGYARLLKKKLRQINLPNQLNTSKKIFSL